MAYYKRENEVFWVDFGEETYLPDGCVLINDDEAKTLINEQVKKSFDDLPYSEKRLFEYPSIGDQLDALYHAGVFPADMAAKIKAVKKKYPKAK
jgi:hypothetical protein